MRCREHLKAVAARSGAHASPSRDGGSLDEAKGHFERALECLPPSSHPADHLLVRLDLVKLHRRLRQPMGLSECIAEQACALRHLLGTHDAFAAFRFPLPAAPKTTPTKAYPSPPAAGDDAPSRASPAAAAAAAATSAAPAPALPAAAGAAATAAAAAAAAAGAPLARPQGHRARARHPTALGAGHAPSWRRCGR